MTRRPRLLVLNEYYWPGVEATAHLLTQLCEALATEYDVTVVTGAVPAAGPRVSERNGVRIVRVPSTAYERRRLSRRDRKSTRLNSSHVAISYAVFCLKKKKN